MSTKKRHSKKQLHEGNDRYCSPPEARDSIKPEKSIGKLRRAPKTKPRSPDCTGQLSLQQHTFEEIARQFGECDSDELVVNIAGWKNEDRQGTYLSIELSPRFTRRSAKKRGACFFDFIDRGQGE